MSRDRMLGRPARLVAGLVVALLAISGCGGPRRGGGVAVVRPTKRDNAAKPPQTVAAAVARAAGDSAADQALLDSLHKPVAPRPDSTPPAPPVAPKKEEVAREAVRLFGLDEARAVPGAVEPTFDIDVTSFAANRRVLEYLEFFQVDAHDRFAIWLTRLGRYEGMIRERLRAKRLPEDLVYLTLVESGLSNTAVSRARAVGMWQFMASTARMYGLTVDPWVDERRDPFRATEAAVNHLADLRERLGGSAYLAAAAYNAGVGRVTRGLNRLPGETDSVSDNTFFQLADRRYLRRETRDYVPKLIAASLVAKQPGRYGFDDIHLLAPLIFDEISIPDATGLDVLARLADTTVATLLELNPQFVRGITPPGRVVTVRVPRGKGTLLAARYDSLPVTDRITFVDHYVSRGQTLSDIAHRYKVTVAMLHNANPRLRSHLKVGERVMVPMSGHIVPIGAWSVPPEPRGRRHLRRGDSRGGNRAGAGGGGGAHRVELGETMSGIARRYAVSLAELLDYNDLSLKSVIRAGDVVRIPPR
jgi:membrane-bound lytic murein transglycosylase D